MAGFRRGSRGSVSGREVGDVAGETRKVALTGSHWGPQNPYSRAHPQLTHTVLAPRAELEARIADTLEAALRVDAAAVVAEAAADKALVHVCVGGKVVVGQTGIQAARLGPGSPRVPAL